MTERMTKLEVKVENIEEKVNNLADVNSEQTHKLDRLIELSSATEEWKKFKDEVDARQDKQINAKASQKSIDSINAKFWFIVSSIIGAVIGKLVGLW